MIIQQGQITCWLQIKIYIQMINVRSTTKEKLINAFQYAVHPIAFQFDRQYSRNYILYFQKSKSSSADFQILGRYEINPKIIPPKTRYYFQSPTAIQYFKVIAEDNLEFKWSLYMEKNLDNYSHEQHMQSKKANLRWCWQTYLKHQESVHRIQVLFGVVKIKFYYLFILGQTHESILDSINTHYKVNNIYPSKFLIPYKEISESQSAANKSNLELIPELTYRISETVPIILQNQSLINKFQQNGQSQESRTTPIRVISSIESSEEKEVQNKNVFTKKDINVTEYASFSLKEPQKHKLTSSELLITKQIENAQFQGSKIVQQNKNLQISRKDTDGTKIISFNSLQNTRHITESQFYNQNNQMIVSPFYLSIKYWVIIIAVILIFVTLVQLGPKGKSPQINLHHKKSKQHTHQHHHQAEEHHQTKKDQKKKEKSKKKKKIHDKKMDKTGKEKR